MKPYRFICLSLLSLGLPFLGNVSNAAEGRTLRVPSEYKTIQSAIDAAASGDYIKVSPGRYKENIRLREGVILQGAGADVTTIDGGGRGNVVEGAKGAVIEGFTITNSGKQGITGTMMDVGISAYQTPMTVANCRIVGNNTGIRAYFAYMNIVNNVISDNRMYGMYILYSNPAIKNNIIHSNGSYGIYNSYSNPEIDIINNTIYKNFDGIYSEVSRVILRSNIIVSNKSTGIHWVEFPDAQNEKVAPVLSHNLVWGNKNDYVNVSPAKGDISKDPSFAAITKGDVHLKKDSPALNSGSEGKEENDPDGTRNDMGAYGGPLAMKTIPSPLKEVSFASLPIKFEMAEHDYQTQQLWSGSAGTKSGEGNFKEYCMTCHGLQGKGDGIVAETLDIKPRDLSYAEYMENLSDDHIFQVIKYGGASVGLSENMIPVGPDLSDEAIRNVIAYIRSDICKCKYVGEATVEKK